MKSVAVHLSLMALILAGIACGSGPKGAPQQTPATQTSQESPVPAAQQAAPNTQRAAQTQTATAVDFEQLVALMPEHAGWTRSTPRGEQFTLDVPVSRAEANYDKGESSIKLQITDTAFSQVGLAPYSMMLVPTYFERSSDGYKKAASMGGSPGFETWDSVNNDAEVTVVVANRFVVMAKGRNVDSPNVVRALVQAVDLAKLAAIKF